MVVLCCGESGGSCIAYGRLSTRLSLAHTVDKSSIIVRVVTSPMSQAASTSTASSRFQTIFDEALKLYQKQTKKNLSAHPLASQLQSCDSTSAIIVVLRDQIREFDKAHSGDDRLTKWLNPTVNVLCAFSAAVSGGVSLVSLATVLLIVKLRLIYIYF